MGIFFFEMAWIQIITTLIIFLTLFVYYLQSRIMRKTMLHQVIMDILVEYRSAEMLIAISTLWEFYRKEKQNFVQEYEMIRLRDAKSIEESTGKQWIEAVRNTLHYYRRLVSQYYNILSGLYNLKIIPKKVLYTYFGKDDL